MGVGQLTLLNTPFARYVTKECRENSQEAIGGKKKIVFFPENA